jgi:hypothetical protein
MTDKEAYLLFHMARARREGDGWQIATEGEGGALVWRAADPEEAEVLTRMEGQGPPP